MKQLNVWPVLLLCVLSLAGEAQTDRPQAPANPTGQRPAPQPEDKANQEANKAEKELALSSEQKEKWKAAALTRIEANRPLIEKLQGSTTPEERKQLKSQIRTNGQSFDRTVNAMLSPEQQAKWQNWKGNKKKEMNKKMKSKKWSEDEFDD